MRRAFGLILLALGVFAVAAAVLLPNYVYPKLAKVPLDQDSTSTLTGTVSQVLVVKPDASGATTLEIRKDAKLTVTGRVVSNFDTPEMKEGSDVAVWALGVVVKDDADQVTVAASKRQVCFDRRTNEGYVQKSGQTPKCQAESSYIVDRAAKADKIGDTPPEVKTTKEQPGINFKFPFGAEQKDYKVYEDNTGTAITAAYKGTATINGVDTYKYEQVVPDTVIGEKEVPGSLVGSTEPSVKANLYYSGKNTMWVEPITGIEVKQEQQQHQELRVGTSGTGTVVFDGTLAYSPETIEAMKKQVNENKGKLEVLTSTGPIGLGIGGGVLILLAAFLLIRRRAEPPAPATRRREHVTTGN